MLHLFIGPVGAGKTTLASQLAQREGALFLNLDAWMARLYGDDPRPEEDRVAWYQERVERCLAQMWELICQAGRLGIEVVAELGLIRRDEREAFYARVEAEGIPLRVYLVDAPREVRRARVMQRNESRQGTFAMEVPLAFFELASDLWEPPDAEEIRVRDVLTL